MKNLLLSTDTPMSPDETTTVKVRSVCTWSLLKYLNPQPCSRGFTNSFLFIYSSTLLTIRSPSQSARCDQPSTREISLRRTRSLCWATTIAEKTTCPMSSCPTPATRASRARLSSLQVSRALTNIFEAAKT